MKSRLITEAKTLFNPVVIEITCESQAELDFLASLFNHASVCNAARELAGIEKLYGGALVDAGGDQDNTGALKLTRKHD